MSGSSVDFEFSSVEQQDEVMRALNWPVEYRQLKPGSFHSSSTALEGDTWFLFEEQSNRTLEVAGGVPDGMFVLALIEGDTIAVNGRSFSETTAYVQSLGSSFCGKLPAGVRIAQLGIVAKQFLELIDQLSPRCRFPRSGIGLLASEPDRLVRIRRAMRQALYSPSPRAALRDEVVYGILSEFVAVIAQGHDESSVGSELRPVAARRALDRAREYIEAHIGDRILVPSLCEYAGITLRSLERIFSRELDTSPQQYIKARRLNATRRQLLALAPEEGTGVTAVAQNCGFSHMGRFAGDYRRYFGESPRETLRNR